MYLMGHMDIWENISMKQRSFIDGRGSDRIVEKIEKHTKNG